MIGQDLWARIWSGTRTSLLIAIIVGIWEVFFGIFIGAIWGYVRQLDAFMTEAYNVINNIPTTILLMLLAYILRPSFKTMVIAMCATGWLGMARFVRNQIVIIRDREYNLASRCRHPDDSDNHEEPSAVSGIGDSDAHRIVDSRNHRLGSVPDVHWVGPPHRYTFTGEPAQRRTSGNDGA